ncbi:MAG TPA: DUF1592 domain-containing protein [Fimbriiglobus sp.]|jgi:mono/diheme cytochrome c family protein
MIAFRNVRVELIRLMGICLFAGGSVPVAVAGDTGGVEEFKKAVAPVLDDYCIRCHDADTKKGGISFDSADPSALIANREQWNKAVKVLRAGLMPPKGRARPTAQQIDGIVTWVEESVFHIDPKNPDPGRVTIRRLNRVEYRNTIRDLMGVDFNTDVEFPADDTGHGFDTIGDVLTLSPLLLEKYIAASRTIIAKAVPTVPWVVAEKRIPGKRFVTSGKPATGGGRFGFNSDVLSLSYYKGAAYTNEFDCQQTGKYQLVVDLTANEQYVDNQFDYNKCKWTFKVDGKPVLEKEYSRQGGRPYRYDLDVDWKAGKHELAVEIQPLTKERQIRNLTLRLQGVTVRGPMAKEHWVHPVNYSKYFPAKVPDDAAGRRKVAQTILSAFAARAYRRPVDDASVEKLARLAEATYTQPGQTFESGVARAMTVIIASPRFLFREEGTVPAKAGEHPLIDEFALASRLSYFLWSSMPDDELFRLARNGELRKNLPAQITRMLADPKSGEFVRQFTGQWLQARMLDNIQINAFAVIARENVPDPKAQARQSRFRELVRKPSEKLTEAEKKELETLRKTAFQFGGRGRGRGGFGPRIELTPDLRRAMRRETEMAFEHVLKGDISLLELLDADYTFLNAKLATYYGIPGVTGDQMRLVKLPKDSPRGGILTEGTTLIVTSNPTRTSPVKRGLFVLDNLLGSPPPPPPPDIPPLEKAMGSKDGKPLTLREQLAIHRASPVCSSCHNRMDPLGLALENFNALGRWRDKEQGHEIDSKGELITGESFASVKELKKILVTDRKLDFYRCLTEKMLTYALGRGLEDFDTKAVDDIVNRIVAADGKPSALISGIVESTPFQRRRAEETDPTPPPAGSHPAAIQEHQ